MQNARQRRAAKRKLALKLLADARNPRMVASEGRIRSVYSKTMPARAHIPFHGKLAPRRTSAARFSGRPTPGDWESGSTISVSGVSDPTSRRAPKDD